MKRLAQWTSGPNTAILDEPDDIGESAANHTRNLDLLRGEGGK